MTRKKAFIAASFFVAICIVAALSLNFVIHDVAARVSGVFRDQNPKNVTVLVIEVVDGDTVKVEMNGGVETIRLLGIDTPETKDPRTPVQCFGQEASEFLQTAVFQKHVRLESDTTQGDRDKYGRLLRYLYLQDGTNINEKLVADGYAFVYREYPVQLLDEFIALEDTARQEKRGLWGGCEIEYEPRPHTKGVE